MAWLRVYVDKKITAKGGGDHSRQLDVELDEGDDYTLGTGTYDLGIVTVTDAGRKKLKLKSDEVIGSAATLSFGDPR